MKLDKIKPKLKSWDWDWSWEWEDLRDYIFLFGIQAQDLDTPLPQVGEKIEDPKKIIMLTANSMYNIQTYAYNKTYDAIAMAGSGGSNCDTELYNGLTWSTAKPLSLARGAGGGTTGAGTSGRALYGWSKT